MDGNRRAQAAMSGLVLRLDASYVEIVDEVLTIALSEREFEQGFLLYIMRPVPGRYEYFDCDEELYELSDRDQHLVAGGVNSWSLEGGLLRAVLTDEAAAALGLPRRLDLRVERATPSSETFLRALRVALSPLGFRGAEQDLEVVLGAIEQRYGE
jgi:hypothetical protein